MAGIDSCRLKVTEVLTALYSPAFLYTIPRPALYSPESTETAFLYATKCVAEINWSNAKL